MLKRLPALFLIAGVCAVAYLAFVWFVQQTQYGAQT